MPTSSSKRPGSQTKTENARLSGPPCDSSLIVWLTDEMTLRWAQGDRVPAEELLDRHPELSVNPDSVLELLYEEICLRQEAGEADGATRVIERFPQWRAPLKLMLECHRLLETPPVVPQFPEVGATVAGFHLMRRLGSGASGRVFLARQPALADRPVVVKFTSLHGQEHLNLARLQHTYIVPLYGVHDVATLNLRILCMPYFGGVTLEELLRALAEVPMQKRTGERLLQIISTSEVEATGTARNLLRQLSFENAMCRIAMCLAGALHYAHEGGLVHFDVKPANVLVAADGQPMLLDFHLARSPVQPGGHAPTYLGGTPGYMPPEQQRALTAATQGMPIAAAVDRRADIYALGAILYQSLGGQLPYEAGVSPPLSTCNPSVSSGLSDIVGKALQEDPETRYADAATLAADLRLHLHDLPLQGVRNRNLAERFSKWRRRKPNAVRATLFIAVLLGIAGTLIGGVLAHWEQLLRRAEFALEEGRKNWQEHQRYAESREILQNGLAHARAVPFQPGLVKQFQEELRKIEDATASAQRRQRLLQLHELTEQVRGLFGIESLPRPHLLALNTRCQEFWHKRHIIRQWLEPSQNKDTANDLMDLALLAADLQVRLASKDGKDDARRRALNALDEAEELYGSSVIFEQERNRHRQALGLTMLAPAAQPRTAWDHCGVGRSFLNAGDLASASEHLRKAVAMQPHGFWPNFYHGLCAHRQGQSVEAVAAFSVCIGSSPKLGAAYYNRALGYSALALPELALNDYDHALRLEPRLAPAALNRGVLHLQAKRYEEAQTDLHRALQLGADPATVYYDLAMTHLGRTELNHARESLQRALDHDPQHQPSLDLAKSLKSPKN